MDYTWNNTHGSGLKPNSCLEMYYKRLNLLQKQALAAAATLQYKGTSFL